MQHKDYKQGTLVKIVHMSNKYDHKLVGLIGKYVEFTDLYHRIKLDDVPDSHEDLNGVGILFCEGEFEVIKEKD